MAPAGASRGRPKQIVLRRAARQTEAVLRNVPGTASAYAERVIGGYYLDIVPDRDALARYGLLTGNLQDTIAKALGGESVTTTVSGGPEALPVYLGAAPERAQQSLH